MRCESFEEPKSPISRCSGIGFKVPSSPLKKMGAPFFPRFGFNKETPELKEQKGNTGEPRDINSVG